VCSYLLNTVSCFSTEPTLTYRCSALCTWEPCARRLGDYLRAFSGAKTFKTDFDDS